MQTISVSQKRPVSRLAVTWVLMVPLVFFAVAGAIRPDAYSRNNDMDGSYTSLMTDQSAGLTRLELVTVLSVCALLFCSRPAGALKVAKNNKVFVFLTILAFASVVWSQFPLDSLKYAMLAAINMWFAFYLVARFDAERQMQLFCTLGWVVIVPSIVVALLFPQYGTVHEEAILGSWIGIFAEKNLCAMIVVLLLSAAFYISPSTPLLKIANTVYILLSLLLIAMTQARTGWVDVLCLLVYVGATKYLKRYKAKDVVFIGFFSCGAAVAGFLAVVQYYAAILALLGKDPTLTGRTVIWRLSIVAAMKRPFWGYGIHGFWHGLEGESANLSLAKGWIIPAAHDGFLDLWLGLGAVGVAAVVYSMVRASKDAFICFRGGSSSASEWYFGMVLVTVVINIASLTLMVPNHLAWILYVLACAGLSQEAKRIRLEMIHR